MDVIVSQKVTHTVATPTEYAWWLQSKTGYQLKKSNWSKAVCAGEAIPPALLQAFRSLQNPDLSFLNGYGPCEATIATVTAVNYWHLDRTPSAGFPVNNMAYIIADENMIPLPAGIPGEIVILGLSIANGYVSNNTKS